VVFRSHDIFKAWAKNTYALSYLMKFVADKLDIEVGYLEIISFDPHIYIAYDIDLLNRTLYLINNPCKI
jgi:thymidylate synthase